MIRVIIILCSILSISKINCQLRDTSLTYFPIEALGEKFVISKFESISPIEVSHLIDSKPKVDPNTIIDNCAMYNLVIYRKLNIQISNILANNPDSNVRMMHERDIAESLDSSTRFIIKPYTGRNDLLSLKSFSGSGKFYIYDRLTNISYEPFPDLESLLKSVKILHLKYRHTPTNKIRITAFKKDVFLQFPKEKKEFPRAAKWIIGGVTYGVFQWAIIKLSNL